MHPHPEPFSSHCASRAVSPERFRSSTTTRTATMSERKAVIKNADMSEDMQQDAIDCATQVRRRRHAADLRPCPNPKAARQRGSPTTVEAHLRGRTVRIDASVTGGDPLRRFHGVRACRLNPGLRAVECWSAGGPAGARVAHASFRARACIAGCGGRGALWVSRDAVTMVSGRERLRSRGVCQDTGLGRWSGLHRISSGLGGTLGRSARAEPALATSLPHPWRYFESGRRALRSSAAVVLRADQCVRTGALLERAPPGFGSALPPHG